MLRVIDVDYIKDYELFITFNDGSKKIVNLKPYLTGEVFGELLDKDKFVQYGLTRVTIEWANGADLAPEFLYEIGIAA
ncbi:DUF2442 domain-containing protein [Butyricimonas hominis]|jgi:hypothetical protein|uniref:DUF2442 domain-containing protein n=1 Tax=Butyricimonas hominis TaxID=2763032 RepID=A0ABR7D514_9BACT|nr:DUF2442 domain-containing protein [Butyricimonas hominis]MBC5623058.1 DUF2442 domain-containing protein [Butyricimonas hominis]